jgi:hypothetical protein
VLLRLTRGLEYTRRVLGAPIPDSAWQILAAARISPLERLEFRYLAVRSDPRKRDHALHSGPLLVFESARLLASRGPLRAIGELRPFLRYRLRGRNEPAVRVLRRLSGWGRALRRLFRLGRRPAEPS